MASTNSTVDGMGFEEIGQVGSQPTNLWIAGSFTDGSGKLQSTSIDNTATLYGYKIKTGSVLTGNSTPASGIITFVDSFSNNDWFMQLTVADMSGMYRSNAAGSFVSPLVSGARHASGCWIVAGSATVVDWMAIGI